MLRLTTDKILSLEKLVQQREALASDHRKLVLTNGCFDLLHVGHIQYLEQARSLGDALAVAVNGDESVRSLKGDGRPLNTEQERARVLAALEVVDYVTIFHSVRLDALIRDLRPMVYAKGGDYTIDSLDVGERQALEACGAEIHILSLIPGKSTTKTLQQISATT